MSTNAILVGLVGLTLGVSAYVAVSLPEGVRHAIRLRLERLSEATRKVLGAASVLGREFRLEFLEQLIPESGRDALLESLDEALTAHVVSANGDTPGRYRFARQWSSRPTMCRRGQQQRLRSP